MILYYPILFVSSCIWFASFPICHHYCRWSTTKVVWEETEFPFYDLNEKQDFSVTNSKRFYSGLNEEGHKNKWNLLNFDSIRFDSIFINYWMKDVRACNRHFVPIVIDGYDYVMVRNVGFYVHSFGFRFFSYSIRSSLKNKIDGPRCVHVCAGDNLLKIAFVFLFSFFLSLPLLLSFICHS